LGQTQAGIAAKTPPDRPVFPRRWFQNIGPVAALVVLAVVFQAVSGSFLTVGNLASILEASAVPAIVAVGISFVIILGSIDLSVEGVMATASMTVSLLVANAVNANSFGLLGIGVALAVGLLFGLFNGILNAVFKMPSLIVTLGTWFVGLGVAAVLFPAKVPQISEPLVLDLARTHLLTLSLIVYLAVGVVAVAHALLNYTVFGRMSYAIGGDENMLIASGLPVRQYKIAAFAISGVLAAFAGLLLSARLGNGDANIGDGLLFPGISAAVLGGTTLMGGRGGAIQSAMGALLLEELTNGLIQVGAGPYTRNIISGAVIVTAVAISGWRLRAKLRVVK
jgi:ribose transport system permease protein